RLLKSDDENVVALLGFFGDHGRARLLVNDRRDFDRRIGLLFVFLLALDLGGCALHGFAGYLRLFVLFFRLLVAFLVALLWVFCFFFVDIGVLAVRFLVAGRRTCDRLVGVLRHGAFDLTRIGNVQNGRGHAMRAG